MLPIDENRENSHTKKGLLKIAIVVLVPLTIQYKFSYKNELNCNPTSMTAAPLIVITDGDIDSTFRGIEVFVTENDTDPGLRLGQ